MTETPKEKNPSEIVQNEYTFRVDGSTESGDFVNEIGRKCYMKDLLDLVDRSRCYNIPVLWFVVITKQDIKEPNKLTIVMAPWRKPLSNYREDTDLFKYDYRSEKLDLVWSIPHRSSFKNFLRNPEKYDKDLIRWIKSFVLENNINLDDSRSKKIV